MTETAQVALITALSTFCASLLGIIFTLIITIINKNKDLKIERMKIFEGNRFDAYSELYQYIRNVRLNYDYESEFDRQFLEDLNSSSYKSINKKSGYYSSDIRKLLMTLDCEKGAVEFKDQFTDESKLINRDMYLKICNEIYNKIEKIFKEWKK